MPLYNDAPGNATQRNELWWTVQVKVVSALCATHWRVARTCHVCGYIYTYIHIYVRRYTYIYTVYVYVCVCWIQHTCAGCKSYNVRSASTQFMNFVPLVYTMVTVVYACSASARVLWVALPISPGHQKVRFSSQHTKPCRDKQSPLSKPYGNPEPITPGRSKNCRTTGCL